MKAILVINMPKYCDTCRFIEVSRDGDVLCDLTRKTLACHMADVKPDWCPLKPMPVKYDNVPKHEYELGWNDCIEEIEG